MHKNNMRDKEKSVRLSTDLVWSMCLNKHINDLATWDKSVSKCAMFQYAKPNKLYIFI